MTTATAICTQPGCGGTVEDGYCMTCGLAAAPPLARGFGFRALGFRALGFRALGFRALGFRGHGFLRHGRIRGFGRFGQPELTLPVQGTGDQPVVPGQARGRAGGDTARSLPRPVERGARGPARAGEQALLQRLRPARRAGQGRQARPDRRVLP
jgi:hypothetical protein